MPLSIENLDFDYGDGLVLQGISATPRRGCITAIIGPNAAGKSTLLRCIIGHLSPSRGHVLLDDVPTHRMTAWRLAQHIAFVTQRPSVAAAFTVRQVVEFGRYALSPDRDRINQALTRLDLADLAERPYPHLSAGQQQRVMLARAVAQLGEGGCLLLDEPTAALDLSHAAQVATLLRDLASKGTTILWAVHDLALASRIADDCWLLDQGRLVRTGSVDEVMEPELLSQVFSVPFAWINHPHLGNLLMADLRRAETAST